MEVAFCWVRDIPGLANRAGQPAVDGSGNVYLTGSSNASGTGPDYATIKYCPNGDTAWVKRYSGPGNSTDRAHAVTVDGSGNVYMTGYGRFTDTGQEYVTIKYYPNGDTAWMRRHNGPSNLDDWLDDIAVDSDNRRIHNVAIYIEESDDIFAFRNP